MGGEDEQLSRADAMAFIVLMANAMIKEATKKDGEQEACIGWSYMPVKYRGIEE